MKRVKVIKNDEFYKSVQEYILELFKRLKEDMTVEIESGIELKTEKLKEEKLVAKDEFKELWIIVKELAESQKKADERLTRLESAVKELAESQKKADERFTRLESAVEKAQKRTDERLTRLESAVEKLVKVFQEFKDEFDYKMGALGARWGLSSEESFRRGLASILIEYGFDVKHYKKYDKEGMVFGYPEEIEIDVVTKDSKTILVEIKSSINSGDVYLFQKKIKFYNKEEGVETGKKIMISPYVVDKAKSVAANLNIEICSTMENLKQI